MALVARSNSSKSRLTSTSTRSAAAAPPPAACEGVPSLILEVRASDPSVFQNDVVVTGDVVGGHAVLRCEGAAIANTITALVMAVQRAHACDVHLYMRWTPVDSVLDAVAEGVEFLLYGGGDMARLVELEVRREGLSDRVVVRAA